MATENEGEREGEREGEGPPCAWLVRASLAFAFAFAFAPGTI